MVNVYYPTFGACNYASAAGMFCSDIWDNWVILVGMSMMIVILFYALVYMLSYSFQIEELKRSAKGHILDAVFTVMLAVAIITLMTTFFNFLYNPTSGTGFFSGASVSCDMYGQIMLGNGASPFDLVQCKLMEKASYVSMLYEKVYYSAREPFREFGMMWGLLGLPIYMQGAYIFQTSISQLYKEIESYRLLAHVCVLLLIGINGYIGAINYVSQNMLRMFLPMGIVLRAIPFTRGIGSFFMALALGFYIVFPILFVITDPSFVKVPTSFFDITDRTAIFLPWPSFRGALAIMTTPPQHQTGSVVFGSVDIREGAAELSKLYYGLILQPIVILSITLVFVRYLTSLFGGETQELYRLAAKVV